MAAIVWSDVVNAAPELADPAVAVAWQTVLLSFANTRLDVNVFDGESGPTTKMARVALVAHFASGVGSGSGGATSPVTSESAGGLARSYASASAGGGSGFTTTAYGVTYRLLAQMSAGGAWLI